MSNFKELLVFFIGVVSFIIIVIGFTEVRIDQKINNPEYINKISSLVRPALIFNSNGSIEADTGANDIIENIKVTKINTKHGEYGDLKIIITPKKHLPYPPLIESIDNFEFDQKSYRGNLNEWIYELKLIGFLETNKSPLFRLEIIKTH